MKKTKDGRRLFSRAFKIAAIKRVQRGEKQAAVARELGIAVELLARWRKRVRTGGQAALSEIGRPIGRGERDVGTDAVRVAELERLVGRQEATISFLEKALRQIEAVRQEKNEAGGMASSK